MQEIEYTMKTTNTFRPTPPPPPQQTIITRLVPLLPVLLLSALLLLHSTSLEVECLNNGLARTPPMGWMVWERFTCQVDCVANPKSCINEQLFSEMAAIIAGDGYLGAGYKYVQIDDCWSEHERDPISQRLVANQSRFPAGIRKLADKVHSLQLKLGIYGDCGYKTCGGYPAQLRSRDGASNYFELDAQTLDDWQVDSLKFDGCFIDPLEAERICPAMATALSQQSNGHDRATLLICEWPFYMMYAHAEANFTLAAESCNTWRYYDDIEGPGHWFDPDQLVIGNFGLSKEQAQVQMAIWCIWSAPLFMSNDLRAIDSHSASILKNPGLIRVNQDKFGVLGMMLAQSDDGQLQAFVKPVEPIRNGCPSFAIVYLNRQTLGGHVEMSYNLRELLIRSPIHQLAKNQLEIDEDHRGEPINATKCLNRLRKAMTKPRTNETGPKSTLTWLKVAPESEQIVYNIQDLIANKTVGSIGLNSDLKLMVPPSGVRVVQIVENQ